MPKSALQSKLTWVGVLTAIISLAQTMQGNELIAENPTLVAWFGVGIGVATALLRVFGTSKPIDRVV